MPVLGTILVRRADEFNRGDELIANFAQVNFNLVKINRMIIDRNDMGRLIQYAE
jgi:hypothetical protein